MVVSEIVHLADLKALCVTATELWPEAEFPGRRGLWYDGVDLDAPADLSLDAVTLALGGKAVRTVIVVPRRIVNVVG